MFNLLDLVLVELFLLFVSSKTFIHEFIRFQTLGRAFEPMSCIDKVVGDRGHDDKREDDTGIVHIGRRHRVFGRADKEDKGEENPEAATPANDIRERTQMERTPLECFASHSKTKKNRDKISCRRCYGIDRHNSTISGIVDNILQKIK